MGLLIILVYTVRTVRTILYHLAWWETKEYRFDRMAVHVKETRQGRRWMFGPLSVLKWVMLILYALPMPDILDWIVVGIYSFEAGKILFFIAEDKRPSGVRVKVFMIGIVSAVLTFIGVLLLSFDYPFGLALLVGDKLLPILIAGQVAMISVPFWVYKQHKIRRAREKLQMYPRLRVIGITGSYGKTTVKDFTHQILSSNYKTLKTLKSQNSDIGIAELILSADLSNYNYFVCEMAAYHPGEIRSSASIVNGRMDVAIITGINEQHQSLFGSLDTTKKAKYELIESLNQNGTVIVNGLSAGAREMGMWAKVAGYTVYTINKKQISNATLPRRAPYFAINAALAKQAAKIVGVRAASIQSSLEKLTLPDKTMEESRIQGITIINDTFNANPDAVYEALSYIRRKKAKKVLVLQPLIELGSYADKIHEKIGKIAAGVCDYIVLTNDNWFDAFMRGVKLSNSSTAVAVGGKIPPIKSGVILLEGKEAESYLKQLSYGKEKI